MSEEKQYGERDAMALDEAGGYYYRHIGAMTGEKLHSKADIAAELGFRDYIIAQQAQELDRFVDVCNEKDKRIAELEDSGYE